MTNILLNIKKSSMDYKNELKKHFEDSININNARYEASKDIFIATSLLFFVNYFFVGAKFYDSIFLLSLPFTYFLFILTLGLFTFFYFKNNFDFGKVSYIILAIFLTLLGVVFLFPFSGITL